jgi:heat shock protein HslJ
MAALPAVLLRHVRNDGYHTFNEIAIEVGRSHFRCKLAPRRRPQFPENLMWNFRSAARRSTRGIATALLLLAFPALGNEVFPYDRQLMLDVAPMGKVRRTPSITIDSDGSARLELWCRSASAQVTTSGDQIRIVPAPISDALPQYMSDGQCAPERMDADVNLLNALAQVTTWRKTGRALTLAGPVALRFLPDDH